MAGNNFKDLITKVPSSGKSPKRTAKRGMKRGSRKSGRK
jgi:hypothetical protein